MGLFDKKKKIDLAQKYPGLILTEAEEIPELISTVDQIESFKNHPVWRDMQMVMRANIGELQQSLEVVTNMEDARLVQGQILRLRFLLDLPDDLIELRSMEDEGRIEEEENNHKP